MAIHVVPWVVRALLWGVGITLGAAGIKQLTEDSEESYFNNGICKRCHGHFKPLPKAERSGRVYVCDVCGDSVWITFGSDKGYNYEPSQFAGSVKKQ